MRDDGEGDKRNDQLRRAFVEKFRALVTKLFQEEQPG